MVIMYILTKDFSKKSPFLRKEMDNKRKNYKQFVKHHKLYAQEVKRNW